MLNTRTIGLLIAAVTTFLVISPVTSKSFDQEEKSYLKALLSLKNSESTRERLFAQTLLAKENTPNSLDSSSAATELRFESDPKRSSRTKRTIGFVTRLGACMLTFMSNPQCWQRLTRMQIRREKERQNELQQNEAQRRFLEEKIYQGYLATLLGQSNNGTSNGTDSVNGTSISSAHSSIASNLRALSLLTTTTTQRPQLFPNLFPMTRKFMGRLFPRLFPSMNQDTQPGYSTARNDQSLF